MASDHIIHPGGPAAPPSRFELEASPLSIVGVEWWIQCRGGASVPTLAQYCAALPAAIRTCLIIGRLAPEGLVAYPTPPEIPSAHDLPAGYRLQGEMTEDAIAVSQRNLRMVRTMKCAMWVRWVAGRPGAELRLADSTVCPLMDMDGDDPLFACIHVLPGGLREVQRMTHADRIHSTREWVDLGFGVPPRPPLRHS